MAIDLSYYKNAKDNKGSQQSLQQIITLFADVAMADTTQYFRGLTPGKSKDEYKVSKFPGVTFSGTFAPATYIKDDTKKKVEAVKDFLNGKCTWADVNKNGWFAERTRHITQLAQHSGLLCMDIDGKDNPGLKERLPNLLPSLKKDPSIALFFISPSGEGLKVIFKTEPNTAQHLAFFLAIKKYLLEQYNLKTDDSGKDVSRLCFICYDPNYYYNPQAITFPLADWQQEPEPLQPQPFTQQQEKEFADVNSLEAVFEFTRRGNFKGQSVDYVEGKRNIFLFLFASNCCRKGISEAECRAYADTFTSDLSTNEVKASIESAYRTNAYQFGKYAKQASNQKPPKPKPLAPPPGDEDGDEEQLVTIDDNLFWYKTVNEKTQKETIGLLYNKFFDFLETQGFYNLKIDTQNVELIHEGNGIVEPVLINNHRNDVKTFINRFCKTNKLFSVLEMLHRGEDKYFARKKFINLNYKKIEFLKDTSTTSYYFHSNCVVEVTSDGVSTRPYKSGEKALWRSQIIDRPFTLDEPEYPVDAEGRHLPKEFKCEFARYQCLAASNPNKPVDVTTYNERFYAHMTAFGYLINGHKPSDAKAIVAVDHKKGADRMEQNGRTGKGIFAKALGYVKKRYNVDGRKFDPKDATVFDSVTMDVKVITVTDCNPNFDFGYFFVPITEDFTFRKLYLGYVTIPFVDSPKFYFDSNFSFRGAGGSFEGRQHIIEFDDYFTPEYKPTHEFGHSLFIDWDDEQWNLFYNHAYYCDAVYKLTGLKDYPGGNYIDRKLMNEVPQEFVDWLDAVELDPKGNPKQKDGKPIYLIPHNTRAKKLDLYGQWKNLADQWGLQKTSAKTFTGWMQKYCSARELQYVTHKTGGVEWVWISDGAMTEEVLKTRGELFVP